jgi:hypothetical protein
MYSVLKERIFFLYMICMYYVNNVCGSSVLQFNVKCWAVLGLVRLWLGIHYSYGKGLLLNHATTFLWIVKLNEL